MLADGNELPEVAKALEISQVNDTAGARRRRDEGR